MNKTTRNILLIIFTFLTTFSLSYITGINNKSSNILVFALFILIFFLFKNYLNLNIKKQNIKWLFIVFSIFISITLVLGYNLTIYDNSYIDKFITYIHLFDISNLIFALLNLGYNKVNFKKIENFKIKKIDDFLFNKHTSIKSFILILLAWLPILFAFYPGIFSYDSSVQLNEFITGNLSNANPVSHTLFLGTCLILGHDIFGTYQVGVLIYSILQMIILSLTMSYIITYINHKKLPFIYKIICLLLFMFLPTHSVLAITTTKDIMFSCVVVILLIKTYEMLKNQEEFFGEKKIINIITYIILVFLMFVIRHNGLYGYLFLSIFLLIALRKRIIPILVIILVPLILYKGYDIFINKYILATEYNATTTTLNAALCVPAQQLGRLYNYADLKEEEYKVLDTFMEGNTRNGFKDYEIRKSDQITWNLNPWTIFNNKKLFFSTYLKYLIKYPKIYIESYLQQILGYFYIGDKLPDDSTYRTYVEIRSVDDFNNTKGQIKFDSKIPFLYDIYYNMMENGAYQDIPVLSVLMSNALYNLLMIFIILLCIFKKKFNDMVPYMLLVGLMITNLLGPVALLRYCYYLYLGLPIMMISLYDMKRS